MIDLKTVSEKIREKHVKTSQMTERTMKETLERLENLIKEDASEEDALALFETMAGELRKEKADFVKDYEKTHKKEEKPKEEEEKPRNDDTPEWAKSILSKIQTYDEKFAEQEKVKQAEKTRKEILGKVQIYPQSVVEIVSDGFDFTTEGAEEKFIEKINAAAGKLGITPEKTKPKDDTSHLDSFFSKLKEEQNV